MVVQELESLEVSQSKTSSFRTAGIWVHVQEEAAYIVMEAILMLLILMLFITMQTDQIITQTLMAVACI